MAETDPASILPDTYLAPGWRDPNGALRSDLTGLHAFGTALRFQRADVPPDEPATVLEALRQLLPETDGTAEERIAAAIEEALATAAAILGQEPSEALEDWLVECAAFVRTQDDLATFTDHFTAVVRQYTALAATVTGDPAEEA